MNVNKNQNQENKTNNESKQLTEPKVDSNSTSNCYAHLNKIETQSLFNNISNNPFKFIDEIIQNTNLTTLTVGRIQEQISKIYSYFSQGTAINFPIPSRLEIFSRLEKHLNKIPRMDLQLIIDQQKSYAEIVNPPDMTLINTYDRATQKVTDHSSPIIQGLKRTFNKLEDNQFLNPCFENTNSKPLDLSTKREMEELNEFSKNIYQTMTMIGNNMNNEFPFNPITQINNLAPETDTSHYRFNVAITPQIVPTQQSQESQTASRNMHNDGLNEDMSFRSNPFENEHLKFNMASSLDQNVLTSNPSPVTYQMNRANLRMNTTDSSFENQYRSNIFTKNNMRKNGHSIDSILNSNAVGYPHHHISGFHKQQPSSTVTSGEVSDGCLEKPSSNHFDYLLPPVSNATSSSANYLCTPIDLPLSDPNHFPHHQETINSPKNLVSEISENSNSTKTSNNPNTNIDISNSQNKSPAVFWKKKIRFSAYKNFDLDDEKSSKKPMSISSSPIVNNVLQKINGETKNLLKSSKDIETTSITTLNSHAPTPNPTPTPTPPSSQPVAATINKTSKLKIIDLAENYSKPKLFTIKEKSNAEDLCIINSISKRQRLVNDDPSNTINKGKEKNKHLPTNSLNTNCRCGDANTAGSKVDNKNCDLSPRSYASLESDPFVKNRAKHIRDSKDGLLNVNGSLNALHRSNTIDVCHSDKSNSQLERSKNNRKKSFIRDNSSKNSNRDVTETNMPTNGITPRYSPKITLVDEKNDDDKMVNSQSPFFKKQLKKKKHFKIDKYLLANKRSNDEIDGDDENAGVIKKKNMTDSSKSIDHTLPIEKLIVAAPKVEISEYHESPAELEEDGNLVNIIKRKKSKNKDKNKEKDKEKFRKHSHHHRHHRRHKKSSRKLNGDVEDIMADDNSLNDDNNNNHHHQNNHQMLHKSSNKDIRNTNFSLNNIEMFITERNDNNSTHGDDKNSLDVSGDDGCSDAEHANVDAPDLTDEELAKQLQQEEYQAARPARRRVAIVAYDRLHEQLSKIKKDSVLNGDNASHHHHHHHHHHHQQQQQQQQPKTRTSIGKKRSSATSDDQNDMSEFQHQMKKHFSTEEPHPSFDSNHNNHHNVNGNHVHRDDTNSHFDQKYNVGGITNGVVEHHAKTAQHPSSTTAEANPKSFDEIARYFGASANSPQQVCAKMFQYGVRHKLVFTRNSSYHINCDEKISNMFDIQGEIRFFNLSRIVYGLAAKQPNYHADDLLDPS